MKTKNSIALILGSSLLIAASGVQAGDRSGERMIEELKGILSAQDFEHVYCSESVCVFTFKGKVCTITVGNAQKRKANKNIRRT